MYMNNSTMVKARKKLVCHYIRAKDDNKPYLMHRVFTDSALLDMQVNTDKITFPSKSSGINTITDVLVRTFNQTYENVLTFCIADSVQNTEQTMSCHWLVSMNESSTGDLRVGWGRYDWHFDASNHSLVSELVITIDSMVVLGPENTASVLAWLEPLPYPFCEKDTMLEKIPSISPLSPIHEYFQ